MFKRINKHSKGFTLAECLVSVALTAVLALMFGGLLMQSSQGYRSSAGYGQAKSLAYIAFRKVETALLDAQDSIAVQQGSITADGSVFTVNEKGRLVENGVSVLDETLYGGMTIELSFSIGQGRSVVINATVYASGGGVLYTGSDAVELYNTLISFG